MLVQYGTYRRQTSPRTTARPRHTQGVWISERRGRQAHCAGHAADAWRRPRRVRIIRFG